MQTVFRKRLYFKTATPVLNTYTTSNTFATYCTLCTEMLAHMWWCLGPVQENGVPHVARCRALTRLYSAREKGCVNNKLAEITLIGKYAWYYLEPASCVWGLAPTTLSLSLAEHRGLSSFSSWWVFHFILASLVFLLPFFRLMISFASFWFFLFTFFEQSSSPSFVTCSYSSLLASLISF